MSRSCIEWGSCRKRSALNRTSWDCSSAFASLSVCKSDVRPYSLGIELYNSYSVRPSSNREGERGNYSVLPKSKLASLPVNSEGSSVFWGTQVKALALLMQTDCIPRVDWSGRDRWKGVAACPHPGARVCGQRSQWCRSRIPPADTNALQLLQQGRLDVINGFVAQATLKPRSGIPASRQSKESRRSWRGSHLASVGCVRQGQAETVIKRRRLLYFESVPLFAFRGWIAADGEEAVR